ncbi:MAG: hypothetical protein IPL65_03565 [Lewinellaceae bacterium]|nr:hypothetical protein [Lewinellaceae bacterium]
MKKNLCVVLMAVFFLTAMAVPASAQLFKTKKGSDGGDFASKLWYGAGFGLGFGSFNGTSQFGFGVSPMVGYKLVGPLSIGPRVSIFYSSLKLAGYKNLNTFDTEAGAFLRARVFRGLFLQGELTNSWLQEPYIDNTGELGKLSYQRLNQNIGIGYNFGGGGSAWSSEIGAYYNVALANDIQSSQSPWDYRFGFTYKF